MAAGERQRFNVVLLAGDSGEGRDGAAEQLESWRQGAVPVHTLSMAGRDNEPAPSRASMPPQQRVLVSDAQHQKDSPCVLTLQALAMQCHWLLSQERMRFGLALPD